MGEAGDNEFLIGWNYPDNFDPIANYIISWNVCIRIANVHVYMVSLVVWYQECECISIVIVKNAATERIMYDAISMNGNHRKIVDL